MAIRRLPIDSRKLLVASIGVAAISYVACTTDTTASSGNLVAPPEKDGSSDAISPGSGNLMPPETVPDATADAPTSGNLVAPIVDASDDAADAKDATDAAHAHD